MSRPAACTVRVPAAVGRCPSLAPPRRLSTPRCSACRTASPPAWRGRTASSGRPPCWSTSTPRRRWVGGWAGGRAGAARQGWSVLRAGMHARVVVHDAVGTTPASTTPYGSAPSHAGPAAVHALLCPLNPFQTFTSTCLTNLASLACGVVRAGRGDALRPAEPGGAPRQGPSPALLPRLLRRHLRPAVRCACCGSGERAACAGLKMRAACAVVQNRAGAPGGKAQRPRLPACAGTPPARQLPVPPCSAAPTARCTLPRMQQTPSG